jgi:hypothetical protein
MACAPDTVDPTSALRRGGGGWDVAADDVTARPPEREGTARAKEAGDGGAPDEEVPSGDGGATGDAGGRRAPDAAGLLDGGQCTLAIQCINGTCKCTDGPNKGDTCDGTSTGSRGCATRCRACED